MGDIGKIRKRRQLEPFPEQVPAEPEQVTDDVPEREPEKVPA